MKIAIRRSPTADTRTCDYADVTKDQLFESSLSHKADVTLGMYFLSEMMAISSKKHDHDKVSPDGLDAFHADFITGFKQTGWYDNHLKVNRHHLQNIGGIPADVNLIDVIEMVVDCVMAGMARSGTVTPIEIPEDVLVTAVNNTVELLKSNIEIFDYTVAGESGAFHRVAAKSGAEGEQNG